MNKVYLYDQDGNYTGYKEVFPDYQPKQGETLVKPDTSLYDLKFDGTTWHGLTLGEYQAQNKPKAEPTEPTPEQKTIMIQQAQITRLMTSQKQLQNMVMSQQAEITELKKQ